MGDSRLTFYEFFAGGGMARLGLGDGWRCLLANDNDARKGAAYVDNFGSEHFDGRDVHALSPADLPGQADLAWASFPCQDLSLAGLRAGLGAAGGNAPSRSGAFYGFWRLIQALERQGRAPSLVALENVTGLLTSRGGEDFTALCAALGRLGYRFGALEIDAARFTPQSRPRLFVVAQKADRQLEPRFCYSEDRLSIPSFFHSPAIIRAEAGLPEALRRQWVWWRLPEPPERKSRLVDILDPRPEEGLWFTEAENANLLNMMAGLHLERVWTLQDPLKENGGKGCHIGALYRRTRMVGGRKTQRAEARFDGLAGCLRTPAGGSSRQFLIHVEADRIAVRRMGAREAARLMGLPESYKLPEGETAALHLSGDGVAVPCVAWLARHLLEPLAAAGRRRVAA